jgi:superfamily I DNA/RNA helicase
MDKIIQGDKYAVARHQRQKYVDAVVGAQTDKNLVVAGPGTGKTYLFKAVLQGKTNTLTLTFVNALLADLSLELFGLSDVKTLHGFARSQLQRVTGKTVKVFPKLSEVIKEDAGVLLGGEIDFDYLFNNKVDGDPHLDFYKKRKDYYGHYGFADLVYAVVLYFERHQDKIPAYAQVVVDEFQDFNALEVSLIDLLAKKSPVLLAGDDDQALYESLKCASAKHIRKRHAGESPGYACFTLPYCSRSTRVIVDAANDIITHAKDSGLLLGRINKPYEYFEDATKDVESNANPQIVYSRVFAKQISWFNQKQVEDITRQLRAKFTVLVLSPTRTQCRGIYETLKAKGFENVQFTEKGDIAQPSLLDGLKLLLTDDKCNLAWRIVSRKLLDGTAFEALLKQTEGDGETKGLSVLIDPSLKKEVRRLLKTLRRVRDGKQKLADDQLAELFAGIGVDAYETAAQSLRDQLASPSPRMADPGIRRTSILVTTIQSSKGMAADYVFITHFDDRYCVRDRNKSTLSDQDVCSFLVALTRARKRVFLLSTDKGKTPTFLQWIDEKRIYEEGSPGSGEM